MHLIGVDVGGTFTDLIYTDTETNETAIHKVPTTPDDPSVGAIDGIEALCARLDVDPRKIDHVLHGTTIATNAVLEYRGAKTGIVTNEGYRDILHIGRHQRPLNYSIMQDIPWQYLVFYYGRHWFPVSHRDVGRSVFKLWATWCRSFDRCSLQKQPFLSQVGSPSVKEKIIILASADFYNRYCRWPVCYQTAQLIAANNC